MSYFHMCIHTIIGAASFHDSVRNGKMWFQSAIFTKQNFNIILSIQSRQQSNNIFIGSSLTANQYRLAKHITALTHSTYQRCDLQRAFRGIFSQGNLISWQVSRLDAFSGYLFHTQLPGCTTGVITGTPEVCPFRSSRTRNSPIQISNAHGRQGPNCLTTF